MFGGEVVVGSRSVWDGGWVADLGWLSVASQSGHVCPLPPSARHKHRDKGMQTHSGRVS